MFLQKKRFKEPRRLIFSAAASGFFLIRVISFSSSVVKAKLDICESCGHFFLLCCSAIRTPTRGNLSASNEKSRSLQKWIIKSFVSFFFVDQFLLLVVEHLLNLLMSSQAAAGNFFNSRQLFHRTLRTWSLTPSKESKIGNAWKCAKMAFDCLVTRERGRL